MTPFSVFILTDAALFGLMVCAMIWLCKTATAPMWLKVALALAFGLLVCWSPLATRAILGYPQPETISDLPDRFELLAEHSTDDISFDLWIENVGEATPLAVTVVPDKQMRSVLREARQKLGNGVPVFISRNAPEGKPGHGSADGHGGARGGASRTNFGDDQDRWVLDVPAGLPAKDGER